MASSKPNRLGATNFWPRIIAAISAACVTTSRISSAPAPSSRAIFGATCASADRARFAGPLRAGFAAFLEAFEGICLAAGIGPALARARAEGAVVRIEGALVVAWTRRNNNQGVGQWLRWQSPPLRTRGELQSAWKQAALWAHRT